MIDHAGISVSDWARAKSFYDVALAPLGVSLLHIVPPEFTNGARVGGYGVARPCFWIEDGEAQRPPLHFAFRADNRAAVDAFYVAAIGAGGQDNGKPGLRPQYHADYYGAFVRDPDGNNIEAVRHLPEASS